MADAEAAEAEVEVLPTLRSPYCHNPDIKEARESSPNFSSLLFDNDRPRATSRL
jgi:hypothetical protein